jgi:hypothetical protein
VKPLSRAEGRDGDGVKFRPQKKIYCHSAVFLTADFGRGVGHASQGRCGEGFALREDAARATFSQAAKTR